MVEGTLILSKINNIFHYKKSYLMKITLQSSYRKKTVKLNRMIPPSSSYNLLNDSLIVFVS